MRRKKGFTLIELLVVIAVIALLVSILMPSLQKARWLAMRAVCISNIHSQVLAQLLYAADFRGQFAPRVNPYDPDPEYVRAIGDNTHPWAVMHLKYLTIPNMTRCPILAREFGQYSPYWSDMNYKSGVYGAWGSSAAYIFTPYSWFAGFPTIVMYSGEPAPPMNAEEASSSGAMVPHRISEARMDSLRYILWDMGHGGSYGYLFNDGAKITTFDQPVGYGDGHVTIHAKPDIKKRFTHSITVTPGGYNYTDYYY